MNHQKYFALSADPHEAQIFFENFCRAYSQKSGKEFQLKNTATKCLVKLFGNSAYLCRKIIAHPEMADHYENDPFAGREKPLTVFSLEVLSATKGLSEKNEFLAALKSYKYQEYLRLTLRELNLDSQEEIYREFSHLAYVIVKTLVNFLVDQEIVKNNLKANEVSDIAILAMGKLGGLELNYSSDIDLIGFYGNDGDLGSATQHEFFVKIFSQLGNLLQTNDENGFLYRVDWDLRPEGKNGTLANSLAAMENYYEVFGLEWERQAFIKAGVLHQSGGLGEKLLRTLIPFTYRKYLDGKTIQTIHDMKSRILDELNRKKIDGINIKLGRGGIRDVEFLLQGLQLLHGGKNPALRTASTLEALQKLTEYGFISPEKNFTLRQSYLFLRRIESALQMNEEQQTHVLKNGSAERLKIARRAGFYQDADEALNVFNEQFEKTSALVHDLFESFHA